MSLLVLGALIAQALLVVAGAAAPVRETPLTQGAFGVSLGENPAFWFRVGVGLLFPLVLAWLAWKAATIRGMMSATGLLYIAVGAVLAGEVLARGPALRDRRCGLGACDRAHQWLSPASRRSPTMIGTPGGGSEGAPLGRRTCRQRACSPAARPYRGDAPAGRHLRTGRRRFAHGADGARGRPCA